MIAFKATPYYFVRNMSEYGKSYLLRLDEQTDFSVGYTKDFYNPYDADVEPPIDVTNVVYKKNNNALYKSANQYWTGLKRYDLVEEGITYRHLRNQIYLVFGDNLSDKIYFFQTHTGGYDFPVSYLAFTFFTNKDATSTISYSVRNINWEELPYKDVQNVGTSGYVFYQIPYEKQFNSYFVLTGIYKLEQLIPKISINTNFLLVYDSTVIVAFKSNLWTPCYDGEYLANNLERNSPYIIDDKEDDEMPEVTPIPIPGEWPMNPAFDAGFIKAYSPTIEQLNQLSYKMYSKDWITAFLNLFNNLTDGVISLSFLPFKIPTGATQELKFAFLSTGVSMPLVTQQNFQINFGAVAIPKKYQSFLDYSPETSLRIYLPFIGERELSPDDVIGKSPVLVYNIDVLTGEFIAHLLVEGSDIYHWEGNCMMHLPISSRSYEAYFTSVVSLATGGGKSVISTPKTGGGKAKAPVNKANNQGFLMDVGMGLGSTLINAAKPQINHEDGVSGTSGYLNVFQPYVYISRPNYIQPDDYDVFKGKPSNKTAVLQNLKGFTKVLDIHLVGITSTDEETREIVQLLKEGVIL